MIAGASGLVGNELLQLLLSGKEYEKIVVIVRKPLTINHPKLIQQAFDFNTFNSFSPSVTVDDIYCCLGTTIRKAGSQEAFRKVDHDYVIQLGKFCEKNSIQKFLVVSAMGANSSSSVFYNRIKGEMEIAVKQLSIPFIAIFRPSLLMGNRKEFRMGERIAQGLMGGLGFLFVGGLKKYKPIFAATVAKAMIRTAGTFENGFRMLDSGEMLEMDKG